jgi:CheY-like chemotaxis protein
VTQSPGASKRQDPFQVLLVEDTLDEALMIRTVLEGAVNCKVTLAQDGIRGCQLAENQSWDLVVTDLNLPGKDGMEVIQASRGAHPETPVIATTAYSGPHWVDQAYRAGAAEVLAKPLDKDELLEAIHRFAAELAVEPPAPKKMILAVGALPGDVEVGCGGILLRHMDKGDDVVILTFTAGRDENDAVPGMQAAQAAAVEMEATLIVGEPCSTAVPDIDDMIDLLAAAVQKYTPDIIYVPSRNDVRESRQNAYRAVAIAASEVPTIYCYQAASSTLDFHPTLFMDVGEFMQKKMSVLSAYQTQAAGRPHLQPAMAQATARYWGRFLGYAEVEPLEVRQSQE